MGPQLDWCSKGVSIRETRPNSLRFANLSDIKRDKQEVADAILRINRDARRYVAAAFHQSGHGARKPDMWN
jgi:hypothetical protein